MFEREKERESEREKLQNEHVIKPKNIWGNNKNHNHNPDNQTLSFI